MRFFRRNIKHQARSVIKFRMIAKLSNGFYYANEKSVSRTTPLWNDILMAKTPVIGLGIFPQEFLSFFYHFI